MVDQEAIMYTINLVSQCLCVQVVSCEEAPSVARQVTQIHVVFRQCTMNSVRQVTHKYMYVQAVH